MLTSSIEWDEFVEGVEFEEYIPIVGRHLRVIDESGLTFEQFIVNELVKDLEMDPAMGFKTLNELAIEYVGRGKPQSWETRKNRIPKRIKAILERSQIPIPKALLDLAKIRKFNLFITTSADTLLEQAIEQVRGVPCQTLCNSMSGVVEDIQEPSPGNPCVYHLFGAFSRENDAPRDCAVTEEDMLEYLHQFDRDPKPDRLIDYMNEKEPIFLGCQLPDGVVRMLFRTLSKTRLFPEKSFKFIECSGTEDPDLMLFLSGLSAEYLITENPAEFASELANRWIESHGNKEPAVNDGVEVNATGAAPRELHLDSNPNRHSVFVSYRRADKEVVRKFVASLKAMGIGVWWDEDDIDSGDWKHKINKGIRTSHLFIPMLSHNAQADESTVMAEWNKALDRLEYVSRDVPYIIPILLDDIEEYADHIPPKFWDQNYYRAEGGIASPKTLAIIQDAFRKRVARAEGCAA